MSGTENGLTPAYRKAYDKGEAAIMRAVGLAAALYELATEADEVDGTTPIGHAVLTLIDTLHDTVKEIADRHSKEWDAARDC